MPKILSLPNLHRFIDTLLAEGVRVVGPKRTGTLTVYAPLAKGDELELTEQPRRSAKEVFFPPCETILSFEKCDGKTMVTDPDLDRLPETVLIGVRPCDAAAPGILDAVFSWDYDDPFYLERRKRTTIVGIACTSSDDACFCTAVGCSPDARKGSDLFLLPIEGGGFVVEALDAKGSALKARYESLLDTVGNARQVPLATPDVELLDLEKIRTWLDNDFEHPLWQEVADRCAGCGACAFLCPACHCFDIVDEGGEGSGCRRKHWDACGFGKFTMHASAHNPRDVQPQRYRNRIMHKFKYYADKFGQTLCTGCGRCIRWCPVGIDIKAVLDEINKK
jgi:ferredoxin